MSCNCTTPSPVVPVNPELPGLGTLTDCCQQPEPCFGTVPTSVTGSAAPCTNGDALRSSSSTGTTLDPSWTDSIEDRNGNGVTLLGRLGRKLARLAGNGFIQIRDGFAFVVKSVPILVVDQWHEWYKPTGINKKPVIGAPLAAPYDVIADTNGQLHAIQGISGDAVHGGSLRVWDKDAAAWVTTETCDVPIERRGLAPRVTSIELAGFTAIPANSTADAVRELSVLSGSGIIVVNQQPTIASSCDCEGCEPEAAVASVATFLPFPDTEDEEASYTLKWNTEGPYWSLDA